MKKNLTLTGMMGVGKSTVGKALSKKLLMQFSDVDNIIEEKIGMSIQGIFEKKGELFFRKIEEKITLEIVQKKDTIISLGGGAFMNSNIRKNILSTSMSFWLDLDIKLLEKRLIKSKKRPLLNSVNLRETLEKLFKERKNIYASANCRINCDKLTSKLITNKIIKLYANN